MSLVQKAGILALGYVGLAAWNTLVDVYNKALYQLPVEEIINDIPRVFHKCLLTPIAATRRMKKIPTNVTNLVNGTGGTYEPY